MKAFGPYLLLSCFGVQAVLNLALHGFTPVMFSVIVPNSLFRATAWSLPFLVLGYFLLAVLALYYLGFSFNARRARLTGGFYFLVGLVGSAAVVSGSMHGGETPLLFVVFSVWALTSLVGLALLVNLPSVRASGPVVVGVMVLLGVSALLSAATAQWVVTDYYIHVNMNGSVPENATVVVGHPVQVPPPNATNASG